MLKNVRRTSHPVFRNRRVISTAFLSEIRDMEKPRERGCFAIFEVSLHGRLIKGISTEPGEVTYKPT